MHPLANAPLSPFLCSTKNSGSSPPLSRAAYRRDARAVLRGRITGRSMELVLRLKGAGAGAGAVGAGSVDPDLQSVNEEPTFLEVPMPWSLLQLDDDHPFLLKPVSERNAQKVLLLVQPNEPKFHGHYMLGCFYHQLYDICFREACLLTKRFVDVMHAGGGNVVHYKFLTGTIVRCTAPIGGGDITSLALNFADVKTVMQMMPPPHTMQTEAWNACAAWAVQQRKKGKLIDFSASSRWILKKPPCLCVTCVPCLCAPCVQMAKNTAKDKTERKRKRGAGAGGAADASSSESEEELTEVELWARLCPKKRPEGGAAGGL